ncbi:Tc toxin subunit A [Enterobacter cancerogenus]
MSELSSLSVLSSPPQSFLTHIQEAGYVSVFDIIRHGRAAFLKSVPDIDVHDARYIYREARAHAETLKSLFLSWQLRQEPVIGGLKKLAASPPLLLKETLLRDLGGDGDFCDLMARGTEYADAASIQSLFSPGRYAVALYKVARNLHEDSSAFNINKRRPDLQNLVLSETTMNQEITSLDLLLEVLQGNDSDNLNALSESFFPMTLPYDDKLVQINAAMSARGRTLNGIWEKLQDLESLAFLPSVNSVSAHSTKPTSETENNDSGEFFLKASDEMVWLANPTAEGANLVLGEPDALDKAKVPLKFTLAPEEGKAFYLGFTGSEDFSSVTVENAWFTGTDAQQHGKDGNFAFLASKGANNSRAYSSLSLLIEIDDGLVTLQTSRGYVGVDATGGAANWQNPLVIDAAKEDALKFTLCTDDEGSNAVEPDEVVPTPEPSVTPNPPSRTTLSLTPLSYQLMVNEKPNEDDIISHYGLGNGAQRSVGDSATQLNDISVFCEKTGLSFNQVLELTAQADYAHNGTDAENVSAFNEFKKYGESGRKVVWEYGAAYLNSGLSDIQRPDERLLWVQPEVRDASGNITAPTALNFTEDTLVPLAGNAEKLIRLHHTTGLSFEMLDWVIVSASRAAGYDSPVLDSRVLGVLATCVEWQKRYGITPDTFVSFIGPVNPYARAQEKSFYETLFTYPDGTGCISFSTQIFPIYGKTVNEATFCAALGVTHEEFVRINSYVGTSGFTMSEQYAGQFYRFGSIPRMLGLTFAEAECLWQLMAGGKSDLLVALGRDTGFAAIDLIRRTEQVLSWMTDNNLNLIQIQAMVSTVYSGAATAEMFTFLQNVYHSVNDTLSVTREMDATLRQKVWRALAGGFGLKANVMAPVTKWLSKADANFTLEGYWANIAAFFGNKDNTAVDNLQQDTTGLVEATQRLSQRVLVARWLNLSEQDLTLLTDTPEQLDSSLSGTPQPDLPLLLLLARFKRWQSQVTTSVDEALRLLPVLADDASAAGGVADKIAAIHNLTADNVSAMSTLLFDDRKYPDSFAQLYTLLTWLRTGQTLNVGTAALHDLLTMAQSSADAEDKDLITRVADTLTAGLTR